MDNNEFSFDALLNNDEFARYESPATMYAMEDFLKVVRECVEDEKSMEKIKKESKDLSYCVFNDAFQQGFCFAVKSLKFMLKI
ncbi:MAG: hypothetical protein K2G04_00195 [Oscillospiraceae bacterium]|nr:hypothetical protein [Oscillospiraceae bacterium]